MFASEKDEEGEHLIHEEVCDLCRSHDVECGALAVAEGEHLIHEEVCDLCRSHDVECGAIGCCTVSEGEYSLRFSEN